MSIRLLPEPPEEVLLPRLPVADPRVRPVVEESVRQVPRALPPEEESD